MGIEGDETPDKAAKEAARPKGNPGTVPQQYRTLKTARAQAIKLAARTNGYRQEKTAKRLQNNLIKQTLH